MGRFSRLVFGRDQLPQGCLVCGGAYAPWKKEVVRRAFSRWTRLSGHWVNYSFTSADGRESLVLFNVYGASVMLETLQILRDGGTREAFFIGSVYARDLPVGTLVIPSKAIDQAGVVLLDNPNVTEIRADASEVKWLRSALHEANLQYREMEVVSVPAVLHGIARIRQLLAERTEAGVEMEVSTFYHFARKLKLRATALLYVSDNETHDLISDAEVVQHARRRGMRQATRVAVNFLGGHPA